MAPRRLSDSEKQDLVGRYKAGESTSALAEAFGCSPNTVSRTVKALLPADAYAARYAFHLFAGTTQQADWVVTGTRMENSKNKNGLLGRSFFSRYHRVFHRRFDGLLLWESNTQSVKW